jgi:hypothetical protein
MEKLSSRDRRAIGNGWLVVELVVGNKKVGGFGERVHMLLQPSMVRSPAIAGQDPFSSVTIDSAPCHFLNTHSKRQKWRWGRAIASLTA